jgi:GNAT superfamily N-acetyltransferase
MRIEHLAQHTAVVPVLASWVLDEWGRLLPEATVETLVSAFEESATHHRIPETFVAVRDGEPVGMASLIEHDMSTRKELSPWLAAVYVAPEFRNRGIGSRLVQRAMHEAEALGLGRLYLFTPDKVSFYGRLGWKVLEHTRYRGENVAIMLYEADAHTK